MTDTDKQEGVDPRCIKCGKLRSDHNYFGEFGYLCHNGSNTFLAEQPATDMTQETVGVTGESLIERLSKFVDDPSYDIGMVRGVMRDARDFLAMRTAAPSLDGDVVERVEELLISAYRRGFDEGAVSAIEEGTETPHKDTKNEGAGLFRIEAESQARAAIAAQPRPTVEPSELVEKFERSVRDVTAHYWNPGELEHDPPEFEDMDDVYSVFEQRAKAVLATLEAAGVTSQPKSQGFYDALDGVMHFINALDSEGMDANAVRSAIYHKCLEMHPGVTSQPVDAGELVERLNRKINSTGAWMTSDLRAFYTELRDTITSLQSKISTLEDLADPIAEVDGDGDDDLPDTTEVTVKVGTRTTVYGLTLGHFRKLRASLYLGGSNV